MILRSRLGCNCLLDRFIGRQRLGLLILNLGLDHLLQLELGYVLDRVGFVLHKLVLQLLLTNFYFIKLFQVGFFRFGQLGV